MKIKNKIGYLVFVIIILLIAGYFFAALSKRQKSISQYSSEPQFSNTPDQTKTAQPQIVQLATAKIPSVQTAQADAISAEKKILQEVPFVVQAPFGNWKDPDFQNGCEEASIVMAMSWVKKEKNISPTEAQKRILAIIAFENKTFGYSTDTNISDIEKIFQQYFKYSKIKASENVVLEDVKKEIQKGNVVIVPAFGRALKNPNFTQPGPIVHMLLIIGYDPTTKEFITNDPGTRKGANYRYDESTLFDAIWVYSSGKKIPPLPIAGKMSKAMLSVSK